MRWKLLSDVLNGYEKTNRKKGSSKALKHYVKSNKFSGQSCCGAVGLWSEQEGDFSTIEISYRELVALILLCEDIPEKEIKEMSFEERLTWIYLFG